MRSCSPTKPEFLRKHALFSCKINDQGVVGLLVE
jgi:hypothetical protein